jgi:hypothetical protein
MATMLDSTEGSGAWGEYEGKSEPACALATTRLIPSTTLIRVAAMNFLDSSRNGSTLEGSRKLVLIPVYDHDNHGRGYPGAGYSTGSGSGLVTGGVLFGDLLGGGGVTGSGVGDTGSSSGISVYLLTGCPICATTSLHGLPVLPLYTKTFAISPGQAGRARGFQPRANTILARLTRCTNATLGENRLLPTKKVLQLLDSHSSLT